MTSTFTVWGSRELRKKRYVPVQTTFYTADGPAVGTIWFDLKNTKKRTTFHVMDNGFGHVVYSEGGDESLASFHEKVASGRYVLVGVLPPAMSHVES